jgi:hypothetical protein
MPVGLRPKDQVATLPKISGRVLTLSGCARKTQRVKTRSTAYCILRGVYLSRPWPSVMVLCVNRPHTQPVMRQVYPAHRLDRPAERRERLVPGCEAASAAGERTTRTPGAGL